MLTTYNNKYNAEITDQTIDKTVLSVQADGGEFNIELPNSLVKYIFPEGELLELDRSPLGALGEAVLGLEIFYHILSRKYTSSLLYAFFLDASSEVEDVVDRFVLGQVSDLFNPRDTTPPSVEFSYALEGIFSHLETASVLPDNAVLESFASVD